MFCKVHQVVISPLQLCEPASLEHFEHSAVLFWLELASSAGVSDPTNFRRITKELPLHLNLQSRSRSCAVLHFKALESLYQSFGIMISGSVYRSKDGGTNRLFRKGEADSQPERSPDMSRWSNFSDATWRRGTMVKLGCALALASLIISNAETEADLFKDLHAWWDPSD